MGCKVVDGLDMCTASAIAVHAVICVYGVYTTLFETESSHLNRRTEKEKPTLSIADGNTGKQ